MNAGKLTPKVYRAMLDRAGRVIQWRAGLSAMFTSEQNDARRFGELDAMDAREREIEKAATVFE